MAKGKYEYWLTPEGLLKIEGWPKLYSWRKTLRADGY